jgi:hypothetical protein
MVHGICIGTIESTQYRFTLKRFHEEFLCATNLFPKGGLRDQIESLLRDLRFGRSSVSEKKKTDFAGFSNARCVGFPDWPKLEPNCLEMDSQKMAAYRKPFVDQQSQN